jgi:hypothetical protein
MVTITLHLTVDNNALVSKGNEYVLTYLHSYFIWPLFFVYVLYYIHLSQRTSVIYILKQSIK